MGGGQVENCVLAFHDLTGKIDICQVTFANDKSISTPGVARSFAEVMATKIVVITTREIISNSHVGGLREKGVNEMAANKRSAARDQKFLILPETHLESPSPFDLQGISVC